MNFRIITGPEGVQGTDEWLAFRKGKIGASDAASIMGASLWESPLMAWERMSFDLTRPKTEAMRRGSEMEEEARKWVNERLGVNYQPVVIQSIEFPEMIASLDGYYESNGVHHLLEIKCPGENDHFEALNRNVPLHYRPQLQHQMMVSNVNEMLYLSFRHNDGIIIHFRKNDFYCGDLLSEEMAFLDRLRDFKPPEPIPMDWVSNDDPEQLKRVQRLRTIRAIQKDLELEEKNLTKEILDPMTHTRCKIGDAKIQKITRRGAIDYSKIEFLQTIDLEPYRKPTTGYWEIRV